uniref:Uncharacterized protein LOC114341773 n=1 Tax=Diabrotica virgifera virgifera TaxID=50390 RepID=A0A6P7GSV0_DIAVI
MEAKRKKQINENRQAKKRVQFVNDDNTDSEGMEFRDISLESDSDSGEYEQDLPVLNPNLFSTQGFNPNVEDYVLVEFHPPRSIVYYVGKILQIEQDGEYRISFLRLKDKYSEQFVMPNVPDVASVNKKDVKYILPRPKLCGSTKRQQSYFAFTVSFSLLNIR